MAQDVIEVDEATAIFKCSNNPPTSGGAKFLTLDGLPSDFYLRLTGEAGKLLRIGHMGPTAEPIYAVVAATVTTRIGMLPKPTSESVARGITRVIIVCTVIVALTELMFAGLLALGGGA